MYNTLLNLVFKQGKMYTRIHDWLYIKSTQKFLLHSKDREALQTIFLPIAKDGDFNYLGIMVCFPEVVIPVKSKAIV